MARLALDDNDTRWLIEQASVVGAIASVDAIGNVFLDVPGSEPELEPIVTGSHLDSQPAGASTMARWAWSKASKALAGSRSQ